MASPAYCALWKSYKAESQVTLPLHHGSSEAAVSNPRVPLGFEQTQLHVTTSLSTGGGPLSYVQ